MTTQSATTRIIYSSSRRTVVTDENIVLLIEGEGGWIRKQGSGGPLSGELLARRTEGRWSRPLDVAEEALVRIAMPGQ